MELLLKVEELEARQARTERELGFLCQALGGVATLENFTRAQVYVFPGGKLPLRQTDGAIGYDAYARAVVDPLSKPTEENPLRRTVADFSRQDGWEERLDRGVLDWVTDDPTDKDKYGIALPPKRRLMVGLGFATAMTFPMLYWVAPRSGYASRGVTVSNSPGTVDPDYRGEAGALVENNSGEDFIITHNMRIIQGIFMVAFIPELKEVGAHNELTPTRRGIGGFGSTGTH